MSGIEVALAAAAPYLTAGAAVLTAVDAIATGRQQQAVANANAAALEADARQARIAADYEAERLRDRLTRARSAQMAAAGGAGVTLMGGPTEAIAETAVQGAMDVSAIRRSGTVEEARLQGQAGIQRLQGRMAANAGWSRAFGSILTGATSLGQQFGSPGGSDLTVQNAGGAPSTAWPDGMGP